MCIIKKQASELVDGDRIVTQDETLWGWRTAEHVVRAPQCELDTRLVKFDVREGPTLVYLIRAEPKQLFNVEVGNGYKGQAISRACA